MQCQTPVRTGRLAAGMPCSKPSPTVAPQRPQTHCPPSTSFSTPSQAVSHALSSTQRQCRARDVSVLGAPTHTTVPQTSADARPSSAETARTLLDIVAHGTLSTVSEDSMPLGTYSSYVLDAEGLPILRLRANAVHTANLLREPRCSLFVQPAEMPARLLGRVTLIGIAEPVDEATKQSAAEQHRALHGPGVGVDAPHPSDLYYRLNVEKAFYVGGMGAEAQAEVLSREEFCSAQPDALRGCAAELAAHFNDNRLEDVLRMSADALGVSFEQLEDAQLLWVDKLGVYLLTKMIWQEPQITRLGFLREVSDERDARSVLTMRAQLAWEASHNYVPVMPTFAPDPVAS